MAQLLGFGRLQEKLEHLAKSGFMAGAVEMGGRPTVIVGNTASYAVHVHEVERPHRGKGQWKYLETPARELNNDGTLGKIVTLAMGRGVSLVKSLLLAGFRIQRGAQKITPVLTGNLKANMFTRQE